jgi:hypothetical protein
MQLSFPYRRYGCVPLLWFALAGVPSAISEPSRRRRTIPRRVGSSLTKERLETDIDGDLLGATKRNRVRMDILKLTNPWSAQPLLLILPEWLQNHP